MWKILNSRRAAVYLLCLFLALLAGSAFVPGPYTFSPQEWLDLQRQGGVTFWAYSHLSTPYMVKSPLFAGISTLLFLSTLVCTIDRATKWWLSRRYEFSKERAFSFSVDASSGRTAAELWGEVESFLTAGRWSRSVEGEGARVSVLAEKGMSGFWGSMVFHLGLLVCFLAAPVTLLTGYKGGLTLLEDDTVSIGSAITPEEGKGGSRIDQARVRVTSVRGEYYQGKYRYDFGGVFTIQDGTDRLESRFAVNGPVSYRGFQFSLHSFGYAPHLMIGEGGRLMADSYLNISNDDNSNYFPLADNLRAYVLFFPDFFREGGKIGTRSRNLVHPVTMVKLYRGDREVFKGLFRPGEEALWEGRVVSVPDVKHWVSFTVAREYGIVLVIIGFALVVSGLFVRFLSNERRIEFEIEALPEGSGCRVRGFSRYYPAFLEKEVLQIAERLK